MTKRLSFALLFIRNSQCNRVRASKGGPVRVTIDNPGSSSRMFVCLRDKSVQGLGISVLHDIALSHVIFYVFL
jgi:hypothetical protein